MDLPLGWQTDLAVLGLGRSVVEEHADHLVVRTPENPTYHWGNFVLVTDPGAVDDAARWLAAFEDAFPGAAHRAIGLVAEPSDDAPWTSRALEVERSDVLVAHGPLPQAPVPAGYDVRVLAAPEDWAASTVLRETAYPGHGDFERLSTETRAAMAARGEVTWFGAFDGPDLAAELGIVGTGAGVARYQSVLTHPEHRRRGLTTYLLGVADAHARAGGAITTVIIADQDSDPGRLYRAAGFGFDATTVQAYREPAGD
jgi:GNAT superfamily N-acetyltransferase